jgi:VanZ family protein
MTTPSSRTGLDGRPHGLTRAARRWARWRTFPLVAWTTFVSYACMSPPSGLPAASFAISDKLAHSVLFGVLAALGARAWRRSGPIDARAGWAVFLIATAWGYYLECLQGLTPDRSYDLMDLLFDGIGAGAGTLAVVLWRAWESGLASTTNPAPGVGHEMKGTRS